MNRTQAQFILGTCPPGQLPEDDPQVAEALQLAEADPDLARWLAETRAFDIAVSAKLRAIAPPADLRDAILAGQRMGNRTALRRFWRRPGVWAAAALMTMIFAVSAVWLARAPQGSAAFRQEVARFLVEDWQHDFDFSETKFPQIREWLARQPGGAVLEVPASLAGRSTYGCKVFNWRGHQATIVCFLAEAEGEVIHIVSVDRTALPADDVKIAADAPQFARAGEWNTALWTQGQRQYLALSTLSGERLARYLKSAPL